MAQDWVIKGSLKGTKGDPGEAGPKGDPGYSFRTCNSELSASASVQLSNITPSTNIQVGDKLVDSTGAVWEVAQVGDGTVTVGAASVSSLKGPKGEQGAPGEKGEDGTGVNIKGSVATSGELPGSGEEGDAYIVQETGNLWVWDAESSAFIDTGAQIKGPKGDKGETGDTGAAATVTVGSVSTGEPGSNATVVNAGDEHNAQLNFTIPRGAQGPVGPGVLVGSGVPSDAGVIGQCYVDIATGNLYRYEETE